MLKWAGHTNEARAGVHRSKGLISVLQYLNRR